MLEANSRLSVFPPRYPGAWPTHYNVEIHAKNTDRGVIPSTQVYMFLNTEAEVACFRKIFPPQLIFFHLETAFENFLCFGSSYGNVDCDLFVTADTERTDGVAGFGGDRWLTGKLFQDFRCSC